MSFIGRPKGTGKITPEQEQEIVRLYRDDNIRGAALGERFGCSKTSIYRIIRRYTVVKGRARGQEDKRKIPPQDEAAVVWRYSEARELAGSIARSYDCAIIGVYKILDKYNVPRQLLIQSQAASGTREEKALRTPRQRIRKVIAPHMERRLESMGVTAAPNPFVLPNHPAVKTSYILPQGRPARSLKMTEEMHGLKPVEVVKRVIPSVPSVSKDRLMAGRGQPQRAALRFPPLPGEPGYVYEEDAA